MLEFMIRHGYVPVAIVLAFALTTLLTMFFSGVLFGVKPKAKQIPREPPFHMFRVVPCGDYEGMSTVEMDGKPLKGVTVYTVRAQADALTTVTITFYGQIHVGDVHANA